jgi:hypothetical protein
MQRGKAGETRARLHLNALTVERPAGSSVFAAPHGPRALGDVRPIVVIVAGERLFGEASRVDLDETLHSARST